MGSPVLMMSPSEFRKLIAEETDRWAKVIKFANRSQGKGDFIAGRLPFRNISSPSSDTIAWTLLRVLDQKKSSYR